MFERMLRGRTLHDITIHGDTVYTAGQVASDLSQDMAGQTRQICARIDEVLALAGSDRTRIIRAEIFITDMSLKPQMDAVWLDWLPEQDRPCRATLGVADLGERTLIEVVITAARSPQA